jgi:HNH/ENDO VII superfamily nuclease with conserved GHE residues
LGQSSPYASANASTITHLALGAATFIPLVGAAAAVADAGLYTYEGDYLSASLSMLAIVPGGELLGDAAKLARGGEKAVNVVNDVEKIEKVATDLEKVENAASEGERAASGAERATSIDPVASRAKLRASTKEDIRASAERTPGGDFIDPNTHQVIPKDGPFDYGHKPGYEWRTTQQTARDEGWTRPQVLDYENDPSHYQIEDPSSNRSHLFELH